MHARQKIRRKSVEHFFFFFCTAHCDVEGLRAIPLVFLPKNTMALLQPMDMGVIQNLKTLYADMLWEGCCYALTVRKHMPSISTHSCHCMELHKLETIANCFWKYGFGETMASGDVEEQAVQISSGNSCVPENISRVLPDGMTF